MGFGTGHHATTRLMLAALQQVPIGGRHVLDVGCGSGILALAAVRLGAESALGVDIDADAVANAVENLELNQLGDRVRFEESDFRTREDAADVVVANLTGALLVRSASHLAHVVNRGGRLIISGFTEHETESVLASFDSALGLVSTHQEDEWMCAVFAD
jgi:ribosomal protein L11 methyltransferase